VIRIRLWQTDKSTRWSAVLLGIKSDWKSWRIAPSQPRSSTCLGRRRRFPRTSRHRRLFDYLFYRGGNAIGKHHAAAGCAHLPGVCAAKTMLLCSECRMESPSLRLILFCPSFNAGRASLSERLAIGRPGSNALCWRCPSLASNTRTIARSRRIPEDQTARVLWIGTMKFVRSSSERTLWS